MKILDKEKDELSVEVARLYYELDYSQQEIASRLGISRPTISRLLKYAKEKGYITINIIDPFANLDKVEERLKEKYRLKDVCIVFSPKDDSTSIMEYISKEGAEYLEKNIKDGDIVGVGGGRTMYKVSEKLTLQNNKNIVLVQLQGAITDREMNKYTYETVVTLGKAFNTAPKYLPLPVIFDNVDIKKTVEKDSHIKNTLKIGEKANVAIFTVGNTCDDSILFSLDYLNEKEKLNLKKKSVGDICSRFFDGNGEIADKEIDNRTVAIDLENLKEKEKSILIAGGEEKVKGIKGALAGNIANILITDQYTAKKLLK